MDMFKKFKAQISKVFTKVQKIDEVEAKEIIEEVKEVKVNAQELSAAARLQKKFDLNKAENVVKSTEKTVDTTIKAIEKK